MSKIDYQTLLENALKTVVKEALIHAQFNGLGDEAHFFITFKTRAPGVVLPDFLRMRYPDVMTIVLQYSYNNLNVSDREFGVQLTFDGCWERNMPLCRLPMLQLMVLYLCPFVQF